MGPSPLTPRPAPEPAPAAESADLFDYGLIKDWMGFAFRAVRRHRPTAVVAFVAVFGAAVASLFVLPKTYRTEVSILAERNQVMPALGNPSRTIPGDADAPTRAATERIMRRDNLVSLIKQTDLIDQWEVTRAPIARLRDFVVRILSGPQDEEAKIDALVGLLEKRLKVEVGDGTVTISIEWPNAQMAFRLVEAAQQNFLETRHALEVSSIAEAISILEGHATNVSQGIDAELDEIRHLREVRAGKKDDVVVTPAHTPTRPELTEPSKADQEVAQLRVMLSAKRRAIADLEDFRNRRLADLQTQLAEQKATYGPAHPIILNTQQSITALSQESPQISSLRHEEQELMPDYLRRGGKEQDVGGGGNDRVVVLPAAPRLQETARIIKRSTLPDGEEDEATEYAKSRLKIAVTKYEELLGRIDSARIELDTARAAFKYRYSIIRPAEVPKKPEKPSIPVVLLGGIFGGAALALFLSLLRDLAGGRIVETWQIQRGFNLAVLAEVEVVNVLKGQRGPLALGVGVAVASCFAAFFLPGALGSSDAAPAKIVIWAALLALPVLGVGLTYLTWRTRPRLLALLVFALMFFLDNPSENPADGLWEPPLSGLASLWFDNLNKVTGVGALHFALIDAVLAFLVVVVIRRKLKRLDDEVVVPAASGVGMVCVACLAGVALVEGWGLAHGGDFRNSLWQFRETAYVPLLAFIFDGGLRGPEDNKYLGLLLIAACCFKVGEGFYVYDVIARATNTKPAYVTTHGDSVLFVMAMVVAIVLWNERRTSRTWLLMGGVSAVALVGMIINNRRLAYVELGVSLLVIYLMLPRTPLKRAVARLTVAMIPVLVLYVAAGFSSPSGIFKPVKIVRSLVYSETDRSTATRDIENFNLDFTLRTNPLLGTGYGHEYLEVSRADDISKFFPQYRFIPHNSLLGLWAFGGLLGFSLLWMPLVAVVFLARKSLPLARRPVDRAAALCSVAAVIVFSIQAYGDMGVQSTEGATLIAAALAVTGKLAVSLGAWPSAATPAPAPAPAFVSPALPSGEPA